MITMFSVIRFHILKHIFCRLFTHDYFVKNDITMFVKEYTCSYCGNELTINDQGELISLNDNRREINKGLKNSTIKNANESKKLIDPLMDSSP